MLRIVALLIFVAAGAHAGPWPMPEGTGHLCFSLEGETQDASDIYASLYAEVGIGSDRTMGIDLGQAENDLDKAVLFLRWPFGPAAGDSVFAYEIGIGTVGGKASLRPGLSVGKGFSLGTRPAWLALDARGVIRDRGRDGVLEAELTLGAETGRGDKWLVQLQMAAPTDRSTHVSVAPRYAFRQAEGRHLLLGATAGLVNSDTVKFSIGLWQKF